MLGIWEKKWRLGWGVLVWICVGSANLSSRAAVLLLDNTGGLTNGQVGTGSNTKNISDNAWGYTFSVGNLNDNGVQSPYYGRLRGLGAMFCAGTDAGEGDYTVTVSLWNANAGSNLPTGSAIATDTWDLSSVSRSTSAYFNHDFGASSSFVVSGNSSYSLTFEVTSYSTVSASNLKWVPTSTDEPGAGSSNGFVSSDSFIQSSSSSSAGSWSTKSFSKEPGLYLSSSAPPAVPEPHEYALMAGLGLIGFGIWRRRMKRATNASA